MPEKTTVTDRDDTDTPQHCNVEMPGGGHCVLPYGHQGLDDQPWAHRPAGGQLDADDDWTGDLAVVAPFVVMQRRAEQAEAEVRRLRTENDELHDDVLRVITQRNLVCERLAARVIPGPDGQDDIDRRRLIEEVSEEAWDDVDGWQEMAANGAAVIAERDRLRTELAQMRAAAWEAVSPRHYLSLELSAEDAEYEARELALRHLRFVLEAEARESVPAAEGDPLTAEQLARLFHETYERLAPQFGYETREASRTDWEHVPDANKRLMVAVAGEVLAALRTAAEGTNRWFVDEDGRLVWPLDEDPRAIYLTAARFAVDQAAPERQAREAFRALRDAVLGVLPRGSRAEEET